MNGAQGKLVGVGLYSFPEAARLTRVPTRSIRRWIEGYAYKREDDTRRMAPIWAGDHPIVDTEIGANFLDLIEIRLVQAFRGEGVSWPTIRKAVERLSQLFGSSHPLATSKFLTDGRGIFLELGEKGNPKLIDIAKNQYNFRKVVRPFLRDVAYARDIVACWHPLYPNKSVVIDPERCFGRPITSESGIPTEVLAAAATAEGSARKAARWYGIPAKDVEAALQFQERLAA